MFARSCCKNSQHRRFINSAHIYLPVIYLPLFRLNGRNARTEPKTGAHRVNQHNRSNNHVSWLPRILLLSLLLSRVRDAPRISFSPNYTRRARAFALPLLSRDEQYRELEVTARRHKNSSVKMRRAINENARPRSPYARSPKSAA